MVASDNGHTARQIMTHLGTKNILLPHEACHIDATNHHENCAESTFVQWFALSLSDFIITQGLIPVMDSIYHDPPDNKPFNTTSQAPISAFSRYAMAYGLSAGKLRYGECRPIDPISMSFHTHGNWVCTPRMFFRS
jgi:hypothetical protein